MLHRPRTWLAAPGALLLAIAVSGAVLGADVLVTGPTPEEVTDPLVVDTTATWEDIDGNGIDDDCQDGTVEANPEAALAAFTAADTDHDGSLSVEEVAHTDWVGGPNCNHGGVVSFVAQQQGEDEDATDEEADEEAGDEVAPEEACVADIIEPFDPTTQTFGEYVSSVAQSDVVGGKGCNHGGAVSEAVHAAQELAEEARATAKAERAAERAAAKAERDAARAAAKAERDAANAERAAARAERSAGKGKSGH